MCYLVCVLDKVKRIAMEGTSEKWLLIKSWHQPKRESWRVSLTPFPFLPHSSLNSTIIRGPSLLTASSGIPLMPLFSGNKLNTSFDCQSRVVADSR